MTQDFKLTKKEVINAVKAAQRASNKANETAKHLKTFMSDDWSKTIKSLKDRIYKLEQK